MNKKKFIAKNAIHHLSLQQVEDFADGRLCFKLMAADWIRWWLLKAFPMHSQLGCLLRRLSFGPAHILSYQT